MLHLPRWTRWDTLPQPQLGAVHKFVQISQEKREKKREKRWLEPIPFQFSYTSLSPFHYPWTKRTKRSIPQCGGTGGARKFVQDRVYLPSLIKTIPCLYAEALNSEGMTVFSASNCPSGANLSVMAGPRKEKRKKKFSSTVNLALAIKMLRERMRGEGGMKRTLERKLGRNTEIKYGDKIYVDK